MTPYGLMADVHAHPWSAFSGVDESGINTRLIGLLDEVERCAVELRKVGGKTIYIAGDLFHVRGKIAPTVLNPVKDSFKKLVNNGFRIVILAGNHDLESRDSARLSSAVTALEDIGCVVVNTTEQGLIHAGQRVIMIPWIEKIEELKRAIEKAAKADPKPSEVDLIIHAPIDGVIPGLPDHGLDAGWLAKQGFRRVFAGHYHNHKQLGESVYSIGALAHHTWSDVGSKAGFLIVGDDVKWFKSHLPEFVDVSEMDPEEIPLVVDGNFARARISSATQSEVETFRAWLTKQGAAGVVIQQRKEASVVARSGASVSAGASIEVSVADFIKAKAPADPAALTSLCMDILNTARMKEEA